MACWGWAASPCHDAVATWQKYFVPAILIFVTVVFGGVMAVIVVLGGMR